jgi:glutathione S-transferase
MELYHNNMSVCAQKVRLVLREKGLRPVEHHLNLRAGDATRPEYLKLNPNGVIPTLIDGGMPIIESTVICEYLDDAYPDPPLRPGDPAQRAVMRLWTLKPDAGLHQACGITSFAIAFRHQMLKQPKAEIERQLAEKPDPGVRERLRQTIELGIHAPQVGPALRTYDKVLGLMNHQLESTVWLAGEHYSLADTALLPYICRLEDLGLSWMWVGRRDPIASWLQRCKARPNYSGIADYLDAKYLQLMRESGGALTADIKALLEQQGA